MNIVTRAGKTFYKEKEKYLLRPQDFQQEKD